MKNQKELPWHIVERTIFAEKQWLIRAFDFGQEQRKRDFKEPTAAPLSSDEMLRQISISIVSGKIRAREFSSQKINSLWANNTKDWELGSKEERHGGDWHRAMMHLVKKHFSENAFEITSEPYLNWGRADIGVYKQGYPNLYVEIGSTSLFKVWINSHTMKDSTFLFVPSVYYAIELQT